MILEAAQILKKSNVDGLMLCANTSHMFADRLSQEVNLPIIHIGEATAHAIKKQGLLKVALLGTKYTMEKDFYSAKLKAAGIEMMVPGKEDREYVHNKIISELLKDIFTAETKNGFMKIIDKLIALGAEGIVLGCTEIPLLIYQNDIEIPSFNTLEIHSQAAIDFVLNE
jgi:aspartate racemase